MFKTGEKRRKKLASIKRNKWWLPTKINLLTPVVHAMMEDFCDQAVVDSNDDDCDRENKDDDDNNLQFDAGRVSSPLLLTFAP